MSTVNTTAAIPLPNDSNFQIVGRLLRSMSHLSHVMVMSLTSRVIKLLGQTAVLGIAAASIGIYVQNSVPGVVNWDVIWTQVGWIALAGFIVAIFSYLEMYLGHYVASTTR